MTLPMGQAGINTLLATIHELTNEDLQHALQDAADLQKAIVDYANGTDKKDRSGNNDGGRSFQFVYSNEQRLVHRQQIWRHVLDWKFPIKYSQDMSFFRHRVEDLPVGTISHHAS